MEPVTHDSTTGKRKRSPSNPAPALASKASKTTSNQMSINYLARQSQEDLQLLNKDDTLPNLLHLLSQYSDVLDRHESLASNLGARPLGPILIKRFERCFDAPPKVVASHHKGSAGHPEDTAHQISWLEVIEFARSHPSQFTLSTFSEGKRVCQFYYPQKQLRVQISEEDFLFINSGRCQELIPPLPIWEDEEKEVGTCDVMEAKLRDLTNVADMVAARTRQLSHRLKGRKAAILERRAEGGSGTPAKASAPQTTTVPVSPGTGFTPVNNASGRLNAESDTSMSSFASVRTELLRHFESLPHNQAHARPSSRHHTIAYLHDSATHPLKQLDMTNAEHLPSGDQERSTNSSLSPVPPNAFSIDTFDRTSHPLQPNSTRTGSSGHRPSNSVGGSTFSYTPMKHNFSRPLPPALESSQPFRPLCQAHMDRVPRGHRVLPPCDRCRRLRMDCVKNLTSCAGCTKKHARCHWRDVSRDELGALDHLMDSAYADPTASPHDDDPDHMGIYVNGGYNRLYEEDERHHDESDDDDSNPLEDLEALGEQEERENALAERTREDEDGLRNAKELARQGREDGLRSVHLPDDNQMVEHLMDTEHPSTPQIQERSVHEPRSGPVEVQKPFEEARLAADAEKHASAFPDDQREPYPSTAFVPLQSDTPPSHGGFRPVNASLPPSTVISSSSVRAM